MKLTTDVSQTTRTLEASTARRFHPSRTPTFPARHSRRQQSQIGRGRQRDPIQEPVKKQETEPEPDVTAPEPAAAVEERLDGGQVRAPQRVRAAAAGARSGRPMLPPAASSHDGAALDDEREQRSADQHDQRRERRTPRAPPDSSRSAPNTAVNDQRACPRRASPRLGVEQQHDQDHAPDDGDGQQQFQRPFGDELHGDERPVRGGNERPAFERTFKPGGWGIDSSILPLRYPALKCPL